LLSSVLRAGETYYRPRSLAEEGGFECGRRGRRAFGISRAHRRSLAFRRL